MIIRQLEEQRFEHLYGSLLRKAHVEPLDAGYTVSMKINDEEYAVKVQPEKDCRIAVLQALRIDREEHGPNFELITRETLLSAFLELLIYQGV